MLVGRADPHATANPTPSCTADTSPNKAPKLVRWAAIEAVQRHPTTAKISADKQRIEARRGKNIAKVAAARKLLTLVYYGLRDGHIRALAHRQGGVSTSGRNPRAAAQLSDPRTIGVVARLIDPACCHRTAPCPHQLGEGMTGSRTIRPCPNVSAPSRLGEGPQPHSPPLILPASADSMRRAGPASRPFVLATLRALRLDPGPSPGAAYTEAESQQNHWSTTC